MLDTEYKEAEVMELFKEEGRAEGIEKGREEGIEKGKEDLNLLNSILISLGRIDDLKRSVHDREFQQKLFDELLPSRKDK